MIFGCSDLVSASDASQGSSRFARLGKQVSALRGPWLLNLSSTKDSTRSRRTMTTTIRAMWFAAIPLALCGLLALGCAPSENGGGGGGALTNEGGGGAEVGTPAEGGTGAGGAPTTTGGAPAGATVEWAALKGRFVYDGKAPTPAPINVTKDIDYCGKFGLVNDDLVVNSENGGLKNVIVYLYLGRGDKEPPIAPSYEETADAEVLLDNKHCQFDPHVCLLRTTQRFVIGNDDPIGHNTKIDSTVNVPINPILPANVPNKEFEHHFTQEERLPVPVSCSIHPWMHAWLVVRSNPYLAVSDENGNFEIKDLPAGTWTMQVWHEKSGFVSEVNKGGQVVPWSKGRVEVTISTGDVDWGEVKIKPELFAG
jgi:hypothetical protein